MKISEQFALDTWLSYYPDPIYIARKALEKEASL